MKDNKAFKTATIILTAIIGIVSVIKFVMTYRSGLKEIVMFKKRNICDDFVIDLPQTDKIGTRMKSNSQLLRSRLDPADDPDPGNQACATACG